MFCVYCGAENANPETYCPKCGKQLVLPMAQATTSSAIQVGDVNHAQTSPVAQSRSSLDSAAVPCRSSARWTYILFSIEMLSLSACMGAAFMSLSTLVVVGDPTLFKAIPAVGLIFLAYGAKHSWESILRSEPEDDPRLRIRHRKVLGVAFGVLVLVVAAGSVPGIANGNRITQKRHLSQLLRQVDEVNKQINANTARVVALRNKESTTFEEYAATCAEVDRLLVGTEELFSTRDSLADQFEQATKGDTQYQSAISKSRQIFRVDKEIVNALREENRLANELVSIPSSSRSRFFEQTIQPLRVRVQQLAAEESRMQASSRLGD